MIFPGDDLEVMIGGCVRWLKLVAVFAVGFALGALAYCGHGPTVATPEPPVFTTP